MKVSWGTKQSISTYSHTNSLCNWDWQYRKLHKHNKESFGQSIWELRLTISTDEFETKIMKLTHAQAKSYTWIHIRHTKMILNSKIKPNQRSKLVNTDSTVNIKQCLWWWISSLWVNNDCRLLHFDEWNAIMGYFNVFVQICKLRLYIIVACTSYSSISAKYYIKHVIYVSATYLESCDFIQRIVD